MNFNLDIAPLMTPLSFSGSSYQIVQLSAGGNGILTLPDFTNLSGKTVKLRFVAKIEFTDTTNYPTFGVEFGTSIPGTGIFSYVPAAVAGTYQFIAEAEFTWDSVTQKLIAFGRQWNPPSVQSLVVTESSITTQGGVQFFVYGGSATGHSFANNATLTVTEFSLHG